MAQTMIITIILLFIINNLLPTSHANGLFDVLPGGGTNGGEEDFMAFLCDCFRNVEKQ